MKPGRQDRIMHEIITDEANRIFKVDGVRYPSVTEILQYMGFIDTTWFTEQGAENGTRRHLVCEFDDKNDLDESTVDPLDMPYLLAWRQLKAEAGITIIETEKRHYNHIYGYCGKPDCTVLYQGHKEVWDRKATANKQKWHRLQGGGYIGLYDDVFYARCVYLQANGKFKLSESVYGRKDRDDFLTINRAYQLRKECMK